MQNLRKQRSIYWYINLLGLVSSSGLACLDHYKHILVKHITALVILALYGREFQLSKRE